MQIQEADFGSWIHRYKDVLYLCHRNADPDAIGSGFALQQAFGGDLGVVDNMDRVASVLVNVIQADLIIDPLPENYDFVVVVDTSMSLQINNFKLREYALVDHHQDDKLLTDAAFYIQRPVDSTAEIIWKILVENGIDVSRDAALGLLVGIITDTGMFRHAMSGSFQTVAKILEKCDVKYTDALEILSNVPADISKRIAALRAANRAEIEWTDDWIVVTSDVSAFEGSSATTLTRIGADVALVGGMHGDVCRISGRARRKAISAGLDLAKILRDVGRTHGGDGGGHKGSAALETNGQPKNILAECRKKVLEVLKEH
ncbi:MAG: DHH family phosphoesterase [Methanotrichaceae archaeon]